MYNIDISANIEFQSGIWASFGNSLHSGCNGKFFKCMAPEFIGIWIVFQKAEFQKLSAVVN
jgi:hypothetical protein